MLLSLGGILKSEWTSDLWCIPHCDESASWTRANVVWDLILSMHGELIVVCYWLISCDWQIAPPSCQ